MPSLEQLLTRSIPELREIFLERCRPVPKGLLEALENDNRHGAHNLAKQIRKRYRSNRSEGQRLHTLLRFEIELWAQGFSLVAGVDEAGMAPLAGPVVAGAVILPQNYKLRGLNDSKKILDHERREELAVQIKQDAVCWSAGFAEVEEIDRINIYHAGLLAMQRALAGADVACRILFWWMRAGFRSARRRNAASFAATRFRPPLRRLRSSRRPRATLTCWSLMRSMRVTVLPRTKVIQPLNIVARLKELGALADSSAQLWSRARSARPRSDSERTLRGAASAPWQTLPLLHA